MLLILDNLMSTDYVTIVCLVKVCYTRERGGVDVD